MRPACNTFTVYAQDAYTRTPLLTFRFTLALNSGRQKLQVDDSDTLAAVRKRRITYVISVLSFVRKSIVQVNGELTFSYSYRDRENRKKFYKNMKEFFFICVLMKRNESLDYALRKYRRQLRLNR